MITRNYTVTSEQVFMITNENSSSYTFLEPVNLIIQTGASAATVKILNDAETGADADEGVYLLANKEYFFNDLQIPVYKVVTDQTITVSAFRYIVTGIQDKKVYNS